MDETLSERAEQLAQRLAVHGPSGDAEVSATLRALAAENAALQLRAEEHLAIAAKFETERDAAIRERDEARGKRDSLQWRLNVEALANDGAVAAYAAIKAERDTAMARVRRLDEALVQWNEAYTAFVGAFDTPLARRRDASDYAQDARRRMAEFDERLSAVLADTAPAGGEGGA